MKKTEKAKKTTRPRRVGLDEIVKPDVRRFRKFLREIADPKGELNLQWEYGNGDVMTDDARAFMKEYQRMKNAIRWALGYTNFRARKEGEGAYWWRKELRKRAGL